MIFSDRFSRYKIYTKTIVHYTYATEKRVCMCGRGAETRGSMELWRVTAALLREGLYPHRCMYTFVMFATCSAEPDTSEQRPISHELPCNFDSKSRSWLDTRPAPQSISAVQEPQPTSRRNFREPQSVPIFIRSETKGKILHDQLVLQSSHAIPSRSYHSVMMFHADQAKKQ